MEEARDQYYCMAKEFFDITCKALENTDDKDQQRISFYKANGYIELMFFIGLIEFDELMSLRNKVMDALMDNK